MTRIKAAARLAKPSELRTAWLEISDRARGRQRHSSGLDGQSINAFADRADEHIQSLSERLKQTTPYKFSPLKAYFASKPNGGERIICTPTLKDRVVQRAALNLLVGDKRFALENDLSYGFIRGRTVFDAVKKAKELRRQHRWAYKTDIASFFDVIDRDILRQAIRKKIAWRSLHPILFSALNCEIQPDSKAQIRRLNESHLKIGSGVRQGMPLSPYFANLMLWEFDRAIEAAGFSMVRYADDLIILANSRTHCLEMHDFCLRELAKIELTVYPIGTKKTQICSPEEPVEFLGVQLVSTGGGYRVEISNAQMSEKKAELYQLTKLDELLQQRITLQKLIITINGKVDGWEGAYEFCDNIVYFRKRLQDWKRNVLEKIFGSELGISPLTSARKRFLELEPL